jgi:hypothetical protein
MGKAGNTPYLGGEKNKVKFLKIELNFLMQADRPQKSLSTDFTDYTD